MLWCLRKSFGSFSEIQLFSYLSRSIFVCLREAYEIAKKVSPSIKVLMIIAEFDSSPLKDGNCLSTPVHGTINLTPAILPPKSKVQPSTEKSTPEYSFKLSSSLNLRSMPV